MPICEFECLECGAEFEKLQVNPADDVAATCPKCGSTLVELYPSRFASKTRRGAGDFSRGCALPGG